MFLKGKIHVVKMYIEPKVIYRFSVILIKILMAFFTEIENNYTKMCTEAQKTSNNQTNLKKEGQTQRHHTSLILSSITKKLKQCGIDIKIKTYQWNRRELIYIPMYIREFNFDKDAKKPHLKNNNLLNKCCWENW